jgi:hypothetical protein
MCPSCVRFGLGRSKFCLSDRSSWQGHDIAPQELEAARTGRGRGRFRRTESTRRSHDTGPDDEVVAGHADACRVAGARAVAWRSAGYPTPGAPCSWDLRRCEVGRRQEAIPLLALQGTRATRTPALSASLPHDQFANHVSVKPPPVGSSGPGAANTVDPPVICRAVKGKFEIGPV